MAPTIWKVRSSFLPRCRPTSASRGSQGRRRRCRPPRGLPPRVPNAALDLGDPALQKTLLRLGVVVLEFSEMSPKSLACRMRSATSLRRTSVRYESSCWSFWSLGVTGLGHWRRDYEETPPPWRGGEAATAGLSPGAHLSRAGLSEVEAGSNSWISLQWRMMTLAGRQARTTPPSPSSSRELRTRAFIAPA